MPRSLYIPFATNMDRMIVTIQPGKNATWRVNFSKKEMCVVQGSKKKKNSSACWYDYEQKKILK